MALVSRLVDAARRLGQEYMEDSGPANALVLLAVGAVTIGLGMVDLLAGVPWIRDAPAWWHLGPLVIGSAANLLRRTRPGLNLAVATGVFVVDLAIGASFALVLVMFDAMYSAERFGRPGLRRTVRFGAGVVTAAAIVACLMGGLGLRATAAIAFQVGALLMLPVWWAVDVRRRTELADAAHARAELEAARAAEQARAQEAERRAAVQAERSRMARELHDAVAGDVSALVIRAGAALAQPPGPGDRESLAAVRESGLHALGELRTMIDVLTEGEAEPVAPTLSADAEDLLRRSGAVLDGAAPADLGPLAPAVDRAGYRILQEALANAARHGTPGTAVVRLSRNGEDVSVEVSNAVDGDAGKRRSDGLGVTSMTERAHAVGGSLEVSASEGAWRVRAELPVGRP